MPRDDRHDGPDAAAARSAASAALDRRVTGVTPIDAGVNALYRVDLADGERAVLKAPTVATDAEFLVEPALLFRIGAGTTVPVPQVYAAVPTADGPLDTAYYVMSFLDGRRLVDAADLPRETHERLVREAGSHLAAIHGVPTDLAWGRLHAPDGELVAKSGRESWAAAFESLAGDVLERLLGRGPLTDSEPRFADLEPSVREALTGAPGMLADASPPPAFVAGDYRPANLVLAARDDADPIVRGVVDVGGLVGDGLLDVAMAEDALIDTPFGGTARAESLRDAFRASYADSLGAGRETLFDERYPYYRLYARADRLAALDYLSQFARESDPDAVAQRWRAFVDDRLVEIRERS